MESSHRLVEDNASSTTLAEAEKVIQAAIVNQSAGFEMHIESGDARS